MNIIEAIKSGKRFRRKTYDIWWDAVIKSYASQTATFNLMPADLIAEDWEIEEEKIEVTKTQLYEAYMNSLGSYSGMCGGPDHLWDKLLEVIGK